MPMPLSGTERVDMSVLEPVRSMIQTLAGGERSVRNTISDPRTWAGWEDAHDVGNTVLVGMLKNVATAMMDHRVASAVAKALNANTGVMRAPVRRAIVAQADPATGLHTVQLAMLAGLTTTMLVSAQYADLGFSPHCLLTSSAAAARVRDYTELGDAATTILNARIAAETGAGAGAGAGAGTGKVDVALVAACGLRQDTYDPLATVAGARLVHIVMASCRLAEVEKMKQAFITHVVDPQDNVRRIVVVTVLHRDADMHAAPILNALETALLAARPTPQLISRLQPGARATCLAEPVVHAVRKDVPAMSDDDALEKYVQQPSSRRKCTLLNVGRTTRAFKAVSASGASDVQGHITTFVFACRTPGRIFALRSPQEATSPQIDAWCNSSPQHVARTYGDLRRVFMTTASAAYASTGVEPVSSALDISLQRALPPQ